MSDALERYLDFSSTELKLTAQNMANASTPGYSNELPEWQANDPVTIDGTSYGQGVTMTGPSSQRDLVLEQRIQQQMQQQQGSDARQTALERCRIYSARLHLLPLLAVLSDIGRSVSGFFSALSQLQSNPADNSLRQSVLNAATTLATSFQSASSQLTQEQGSLDQQSATVVTQVNSLTQAIAQLNSQISQTSGSEDAGQLEDQRQYDIQQLSQLVGIHPITTEDNSLTITTSSGALLVSKGAGVFIEHFRVRRRHAYLRLPGQ